MDEKEDKKASRHSTGVVNALPIIPLEKVVSIAATLRTESVDLKNDLFELEESAPQTPDTPDSTSSSGSGNEM